MSEDGKGYQPPDGGEDFEGEQDEGSVFAAGAGEDLTCEKAKEEEDEG